jgi:hypothetical protein
MKITVALVLSAAILLSAASAPGLQAGGLLAMGSKRGFDEMKDSREDKGRLDSGAGKVEDGGENRPPEGGEDKSGNSPSRKKPRLKYRDLYECGC